MIDRSTVGEIVMMDTEPSGGYVKVVVEHNEAGDTGPAWRWHTTMYLPKAYAQTYRIGQRVRCGIAPDDRCGSA